MTLKLKIIQDLEEEEVVREAKVAKVEKDKVEVKVGDKAKFNNKKSIRIFLRKLRS